MNKVVLLAPTPPPAGGIAAWTVRMLNTELKNGWKIELVDEKLSGNREVFGDKVKNNLFVEMKRCFRIWHDLAQKLKDDDVKVVHSCIPSSTTSMLREYICMCIAKYRKCKFIMHFRCTVPNTTKGIISNFLLKRLCAKCDAIILLNNPSVEYVSKITSVPLYLIPNFVDATEIVEKKLIKEKIETVLYVGGVTEDKGCGDIIEVAKAFPEIQFRLVGQAESYVSEMAKNVPNVILTGPKDRINVKEELLKADIFMFLSHFYGEGFSNALAEAMACGLPCIVSDWAANADMIENKGGTVVACSDVFNTIAALRTEESIELRKQQSDFNICKVKNEYVDRIIVDRYVGCYEHCIN